MLAAVSGDGATIGTRMHGFSGLLFLKVVSDSGVLDHLNSLGLAGKCRGAGIG